MDFQILHLIKTLHIQLVYKFKSSKFMTTINEIMTKTVLTAKTDTPFEDVVNAMMNSKINHLPITNPDGSLRGIISASDVLQAIHELDKFAINYNGYSLEKRLDIKNEMSSDFISINFRLIYILGWICF